jgi:hypothetical protein
MVTRTWAVMGRDRRDKNIEAGVRKSWGRDRLEIVWKVASSRSRHAPC